MGGEDRIPVAIHAPRPATVGGSLPANAPMAQSGSVRGDDPRFARNLATFGGQGARSDGGHIGLSHAEIYPGERPSGRLRWAQGQEGHKGACCGGHTLGHLLALRVSPANEDDSEEVRKLSEEIQQAIGENVELAYVDQGYTGERVSGFAA